MLTLNQPLAELNSMELLPSSRYVRWPGVKEVLGFCWTRAHVITLVRQGKFPAPIKLSSNSVAWIVDELLEWKENRERAIPPPAKTPKPPRRPEKQAVMMGHNGGPAIDDSRGATAAGKPGRVRVRIEGDV
jgi:predicted DNA-binding transcriptional regulator AlpA